MDKAQLLYIIIVLYLSIIIGSIIKFRTIGVKGLALVTSVFVPLILVIMPILIAIKGFNDKKEPLKQRIFRSCYLFKDTIRVSPALVGLLGTVVVRNKIAKKASIKKVKKKNYIKKKPIKKDLVKGLDLFEEFINSHGYSSTRLV